MKKFAVILAFALWGCGPLIPEWRGGCTYDEFDGAETCSIARGLSGGGFGPRETVLFIADSAADGLEIAVSGPEGARMLGVDFRFGSETSSAGNCMRNACWVDDPERLLDEIQRSDSFRVRVRMTGRDTLVTEVSTYGFDAAMLDAPRVQRRLNYYRIHAS